MTSYIDDRAETGPRHGPVAGPECALARPHLATGGICHRPFRQVAHGRSARCGRGPAHHGIRLRRKTRLPQFEGLGRPHAAACWNDLRRHAAPQEIDLGVASEKLGRGHVTWMDRCQSPAASWTGPRLHPAMREGGQAVLRERLAGRCPFAVLPAQGACAATAPRKASIVGVVATDAQLGPLFDYVRNDPRLSRNTLILLLATTVRSRARVGAGPFRGSKGNSTKAACGSRSSRGGPRSSPPPGAARRMRRR